MHQSLWHDLHFTVSANLDGFAGSQQDSLASLRQEYLGCSYTYTVLLILYVTTLRVIEPTLSLMQVFTQVSRLTVFCFKALNSSTAQQLSGHHQQSGGGINIDQFGATWAGILRSDCSVTRSIITISYHDVCFVIGIIYRLKAQTSLRLHSRFSFSSHYI